MSNIINFDPNKYVRPLADFLEALEEWNCEDNEERARAILQFQRSGYDLSAYLEQPHD